MTVAVVRANDPTIRRRTHHHYLVTDDWDFGTDVSMALLGYTIVHATDSVTVYHNSLDTFDEVYEISLPTGVATAARSPRP